MQRNTKLVRWGLMIFALFIIGITTSAGQLLATKASVSLDQNNKPSCQLVKGTQGDTKLTLSSQIPDSVEDILTENSGSVKFSLLCNQSPAASPTPCIEASRSKCSTGTPSSNPSSNPTPDSTNPNPNSGPSQTIGVNCLPQGTQIGCTVTGPSTVTFPLPGGPLTCMYQNGQLSCTSPTGLTLPTPDGPINCGIQNGQISCTGSALMPLLSTLLGVTAPPNGTVSCTTQNNQLACNGGSNPTALVTCMFQGSQSVCTAPIPSNLGLPIHTTLNCVNQNSQHTQMTCSATPTSAISIPTTISHSNNIYQLVFISQTSKPSCQLVKGGDAGNTLLTLSSDISGKLKGLLEKKDGSLKYSLNCKK